MNHIQRIEATNGRHSAIIVLAESLTLERIRADEPYASLPWEDVDAFSAACIEDLLEQGRAVPHADLVLMHQAVRPSDEFLRSFQGRVHLMELPDRAKVTYPSFIGDFLASTGYTRVIIIFQVFPLLSSKLFSNTFSILGSEDDNVVLGQTPEGSCFYLGLRSPYPQFFSESSPDLLEKSSGILSMLCKENVILCPIDPVFSLKSGVDLYRLREMIEDIAPDDPLYPKNTAAVFRIFDKKYKPRKPVQ